MADTISYHGYARRDWVVDGCEAILVAPHEDAPGRPWIWRAEFFDGFPGVDLALLARGFHLAYIQVGNTFGCPDALAHWDVFYPQLVGEHGLSRKPVLEGISRGGLYIYNWAVYNTDKVGGLYGDAPVCDFKTWPGGFGLGPASPEDWQQLLAAYHFASDAEALAYPGNPVDNLAPLAAAGIPLLHVYGDADDLVRWEENTGVVAERYRALGGEITVIPKPGVGHHPHGLEDPTPIVEWVVEKTRAS
jgi:hypothetical protein